MKELKIEAPKGYEVDKDNSTFECIKFKKKKQVDIRKWDDLCEASIISDKIRVSGFCISDDSNIYMAHRLFVGDHSRNVFVTEKEAKSARAAAMISQLMPYYGGAITDKEWENADIMKFVITRSGNNVSFKVSYDLFNWLAFHTEWERDTFYNMNEELVKDYLMIY